MSDPFPDIKSKHSLVAKYVTEPIWEKLSRAKTQTSGISQCSCLFIIVNMSTFRLHSQQGNCLRC